MRLTPKTQIGSYEISGAIGAGGMGEVYRARDRKLNRDVAIKILPQSVSRDPERLRRLTREAHALAALSHANIAHIYDAGTADGTAYLVMELVDGEDLSTLIARGPVPLPDALPLARQIADALEAAHDNGIVHRDLKPANVKIRTDGTVKVLDFGLAKALAPPGSDQPAPDLANSPTVTTPATQNGVILGTAAYMSPEQARGRSVDRRADIWAFGVVLYEMLTGRRAFDGEGTSEVIAAVLRSEPDFAALPAGTPSSVRRLLRRCLEKDPRKRLSAIADARLELDEPDPAVPAVEGVPIRSGRTSPATIALAAIAGVVLTAVIAALLWPSPDRTGTAEVTRTSLLGPPGLEVYPDSPNVAISPDGRMIAFITGNVPATETQLWVRPIDSLTARRIEDADGALLPFWSPDSQRLGFFAKRKLKSVALAGGRVDVLADAPATRGGAWNAANVIVFAPQAGGALHRVSANGGDATPVTSLDAARHQFEHRFPSFLPDGEHFLYAALPGHDGKFDIFVGALGGGEPRFLGAMETSPVYADPGWLIFAKRSVLVAQPFDARALTLAGDAVSLGDQPDRVHDPAFSSAAGHAASISARGSLAYFSAPSQNVAATWLDSKGQPLGRLNLPPGFYSRVKISPDGTQAVLVKSISPSESSLWVADLDRGSTLPLSTGGGRNDSPVWSPDGTRVVFASDRDGPQDLFVKTVGNPSPEHPLYRSDVLFKHPNSWSPDGKWILFQRGDPETSQNIYRLLASGDGQPISYLQGRARDDAATVSPDGRWCSYYSDESGRPELYIQSFPEPGRRAQLSTDGALLSWWMPDSRALIFVGRDRMSLWRVEIQSAVTLRARAPERIATLPPKLTWIDATPDRQRFLALTPERAGTGALTLVQHWQARLEK